MFPKSPTCLKKKLHFITNLLATVLVVFNFLPFPCQEFLHVGCCLDCSDLLGWDNNFDFKNTNSFFHVGWSQCLNTFHSHQKYHQAHVYVNHGNLRATHLWYHQLYIFLCPPRIMNSLCPLFLLCSFHILTVEGH